MLTDALLNTAHDLAIGLALAIIAFAFLYLLVKSNEGLRRRENARREEFTPRGSEDFRRALRFRGVAFDDLGRERIAMDATSKREARRG
jgi:hypothetical protein